MGLNRCGSTAVGWSLLIQTFLGHGCHVELEHHSFPHFTCPHSAIALFAQKLCWIKGVQRSRPCHPESLPVTVFLDEVWPFCGTPVFGPESCFSQPTFILLDSFISPTAGPQSVSLWCTLLPARLLNSEFWQVGTLGVETSIFFPPRKLKPLHTESSTSS